MLQKMIFGIKSIFNNKFPVNINQRGAIAGGDIVGGDKSTIHNYQSDPALADKEITQALHMLRVKRWFSEFDSIGEAKRFALLCTEGTLTGGSLECRHHALACCARILSNGEDQTEAERTLEEAKKLGSKSEDASIAEAFIVSKQQGKSAALRILGGLNTPASRYASLVIVTRADGNAEALEWFSQTGLSPEHLDAEGKKCVLGLQLEIGDWEAAFSTAAQCSEKEHLDCPVLHLDLAFIELLKITPAEYRHLVRTQLPFELKGFDLASDGAGLESHQKAHTLFTDVSKVFEKLELTKAAAGASYYALWLGLRHPTLLNEARNALREGLRDPARSLKLVPLALQFGEQLDIQAIEDEINYVVARNGGSTVNTALARFSIAMTQPTRIDIVNYIDRHRDELKRHIDPRRLGFTEIEMLAKSGQTDRAQQAFANLKTEIDLSEDEVSRLRKTLSLSTGEGEITLFRKEYDENKSLNSLKNLVDLLYNNQEWDQLAIYAVDYFATTKSLSAAEKFIASLVKTDKDADALHFLEKNREFLSQSGMLRRLHCWALYRSGKVLKAREALKHISPIESNEDYLHLRQNIAIACGDWNDLSQIVADEFSKKTELPARRLLQAAHLAYHIGAPESTSRELLFTAASKGEDDPYILAAAYFLATNVGIEENVEVSRWIQRAAELSGEEGPIFQTSIYELVRNQPEWNRQHEYIQGLLRRGELPMLLAAPYLKRSLIEMTLLPLFSNLQTDDPRRRIFIPAFSGKRELKVINSPGVLGFDVSALLTLGGLDLLDKLSSLECQIKIPHSTLHWLFTEREQAFFHQPSRVKRAQEVLDLLAADKLSVIKPTSMAKNELRELVGDELAALITEAETEKEQSDFQHIVIRSAPVTKLGTFLDVDADLGAHADVLVSCQSLVTKLAEMGRITSAKARQASSYLKLNEKIWPNEGQIQDNAILYLDDLSVTYLQTCGVIGEIKDAGFTVFVSESTFEMAQRLTNYSHLSEQVKSVIERIRVFISNGLAAGNISLGKAVAGRDLEAEVDVAICPAYETMQFGPECDAVVIDDRFLNKKDTIATDKEGGTCQVISSLELLSIMREKSILNEDDVRDIKFKLRRGGYLFIGFKEDELYDEIVRCSVENGVLVESAELRAIREYILFVRFTGILHYPDETIWIEKITKIFVDVLKRLWSAGENTEDIAARSDWLLPHLDVRSWLHCFPCEQASRIFHEDKGLYLSTVMAVASGLNDDLRQEYLKWYDDRIGVDVNRETPLFFKTLVENFKNNILGYIDSHTFADLDEIMDETAQRSFIGKIGLNLLPKSIKEAVIQDNEFLDQFGMTMTTDGNIATEAGGPTFRLSELFSSIRSATPVGQDSTLFDHDDNSWVIRIDKDDDDQPNVILASENKVCTFSWAPLLLENPDQRLKRLEQEADQCGLPIANQESWRSVLSDRPLTDEELCEFLDDIGDTAIKRIEQLRTVISAGRAAPDDLVPQSRRYYERLIGDLGDAKSFCEHANAGAQTHVEELIQWHPRNGLLLSLLIASQSKFSGIIPIQEVPPEVIASAFEYLAQRGDRLSQLAAVEVGVPLVSSIPELHPLLISLVEAILGDEPNDTASEFGVLSGLFILVDAKLSSLGLFMGYPPFYRRQAAFAHASLIHRQFIIEGADPRPLCDWAIKNLGRVFYAQSLVDMRNEPLWFPDCIHPTQLKQEFVGRLLEIGANYNNVLDGRLAELLSPDSRHDDNVKSHAELLKPYYSGPLEGAQSPRSELTDDLRQLVEEQLSQQNFDQTSFAAIINFSHVFKLGPDLSARLAQSIKENKYKLGKIDNVEQVGAILLGLAKVAAITRSGDLAQEVRILIRKHRRDPVLRLPIYIAMSAIVTTAAAYPDLTDWLCFVGESLEELSFGALDKDEGQELYYYIQCLCTACPDLWTTVGGAEAVLSALSSI